MSTKNILKIASITMVLVLVTSILTSITLHAADSRQKTNLEKCIGQLESSKTRIEEFIEGRGIKLPEDIKGNLTKAGELLESARNFINEGKYNETRKCIQEAMGCLRIVANYVCRQVREEVREMVQERTAIGLKVAIQTHQKFINKLNDTVELLKEKGITVDEDITKAIDDANKILREALSLLEEGRINETAKLLGESKRIIAGIIGELNKLIRKEIEEARIAKEIGKHIRRMEEITRNIENEVAKKGREEAISHLKEVIDKLNESSNKLNQLKKYLEEKGKKAKEISEAITKIRGEIDHIEKIGKKFSK
ncbi:MAG: hypothetical protein QXP91_02940 [Candidatus Methanomethylicia archaeon]